MYSTAKVLYRWQMAGPTKDPGQRAACMAMAYTHGLEVSHTKDSTTWTKSKDTVAIVGKMGEGTSVTGKITKDMEKGA